MQNALKSVIELLERSTRQREGFADELTEHVMQACIKLSKEGEKMCHVARVMSALALEYSRKADEAQYWRKQAEDYKSLLDACKKNAPQETGKEVHIHQPGSYYFNESQLPESRFGLTPPDPSGSLPMAK